MNFYFELTDGTTEEDKEFIDYSEYVDFKSARNLDSYSIELCIGEVEEPSDDIVEELFLAMEADQLDEFCYYWGDQNCDVTFDRFTDAFMGYFDSFGEFAKQRESEVNPEAVERFGSWVDWEKFAEYHYRHDFSFNEEGGFVYMNL